MIIESSHRVTPENGPRPAGRPDECFYCGQPLGALHKDDCVLFKKTIRVRAIVEYVIAIPAEWDKEMFEFHRNESSWCGTNGLEEIGRLATALDRLPHRCGCDLIEYEYLGEADTDRSDDPRDDE